MRFPLEAAVLGVIGLALVFVLARTSWGNLGNLAAPQDTLPSVRIDLDALRRQSDRLEAQVRGLKAEWSDHEMKVDTMIRRMVRQRLLMEKDLPAQRSADDPTETPVTVSARHAVLSGFLKKQKQGG